MKKLLSVVLALVMIFGLASCGGGSDEGAEGTTPDNCKIGIILLMEHTSLNMIKDSIIEELAAKGYVDGETCTIDVQNGQADMSVMKSIAQKFVSQEYDVIIPIATPAAQAALSETTDIPIIFAAISDPIAAGLLTDRENPDGNVTGTSDEVVAANMMELAAQMTPGFTKVGALYCSAEANSIAVVEGLRDYCAANGLELIESTVQNTNEVQAATQYLADKVDIVFSPTDNTVASAMSLVTDVLYPAGVPIYVSADSMVMDGGTATYGIDYVVLGHETADMVVDVLNGTAIADLPVRTMTDLSLYVNKDAIEKLAIEMPADLDAVATYF